MASKKKSYHEKLQESEFRCTECLPHKHFLKKKELTVHMQRHKGLEPYKCWYCSKKFALKAKLISHELIEHKGQKGKDKSYQCSICGQAFTSNWALVVHQKRHEGENPYQCSQCGESFGRKRHLKKHNMTHRYGGAGGASSKAPSSDIEGITEIPDEWNQAENDETGAGGLY